MNSYEKYLLYKEILDQLFNTKYFMAGRLSLKDISKFEVEEEKDEGYNDCYKDFVKVARHIVKENCAGLGYTP